MKNLYERSILAVAIFVLLLIAAQSFAQRAHLIGQQTFELTTRHGRLVVTQAGPDALLVRSEANGVINYAKSGVINYAKSGVIHCEHLDKAGVSVSERFASLCLMAEDGSMTQKAFLAMQANGCFEPSTTKSLRRYWRKANKVYRDLSKVLPHEVLLETAYLSVGRIFPSESCP